MSKSELRATVTKRLAAIYEAADTKLLSEIVRDTLGKTDKGQVIVITEKAMGVLWKAYKSGTGAPSSEKPDYIEFMQKAFRSEHIPLRESPRLNNAFLARLLKSKGWWWKRDVVHIGKAFNSIGAVIDRFNKEYNKTPGHKGRLAEKGAVHLDHGVGEIGVSGLGAVPAYVYQARQINPTVTLEALYDNIPTELISEAARSEYKNLIMNWTQFINPKNGHFRAGMGIILEPVSKTTNKEKSGREKRELNVVLKSMEATLLNIDYKKVKGSNSLEEKVEKFLVDSVASNLGNKKKVKIVTSGNVKTAKLNTKTTVSERVGGNRIRVSKPRHALRSPITGLFVSRESVDQMSPTSLMAILKAKLPEYVSRNMGTPRLNYISGRFADSTTITKIIPSRNLRQGQDTGPTIEYSYMKYPYQTFEPGWAQGSFERDPRPLIDMSIRQILANFQMTQFTTQRQE